MISRRMVVANLIVPPIVILTSVVTAIIGFIFDVTMECAAGGFDMCFIHIMTELSFMVYAITIVSTIPCKLGAMDHDGDVTAELRGDLNYFAIWNGVMMILAASLTFSVLIDLESMFYLSIGSSIQAILFMIMAIIGVATIPTTRENVEYV